jgi:hypothetical protein
MGVPLLLLALASGCTHSRPTPPKRSGSGPAVSKAAPASPTVSGWAALGCTPQPRWVVRPVPANHRSAHTQSEATKLALTVSRPPVKGPIRATLALVTDPIAVKVGLPSSPRTMWMVRHSYILQASFGSSYSPRTKFGTLATEVTFVDDSTLTLAGNSGC